MKRFARKSRRAAPLLWSGWAILLVFLLIGSFSGADAPSSPEPATGPAIVLDFEGPIGPATDDYFRRALDDAVERDASVVIIRMDTPGGLDASMRTIIRKILDAPIPVAVYVSPEGARATSAGTYILYASHIAAMAPGTHLGAATPVQMGGPGMFDQEPDDEENEEEQPAGDAMQRKIISDAVAYIRSLAELRDRNADWAELAVREGVSLSSSEALEKNVIDLLVPDIETLLEEMDGETVKVAGTDHVLATAGAEVAPIEPDWRTRLLSILTNPNVAYILLLLGLYGLILEFSNPGALVPGVIGAICLLLAMFAFQMLPINYAGLALIILGVILMIAEAFAPSFGVLGIGGIISFVIGSIILIDTDIPGFALHLPIILAFAVSSGLIFIFVFALALKSWRRPVVSGRESLVGAQARAMDDFEGDGWVRLQGESWKARSAVPVKKGQSLKVTQVDNLLVHVEPTNESEQKGAST